MANCFLPCADIEINVTTKHVIGEIPDMDLSLAESFTTTFDLASQVATREIKWHAYPSNVREVFKEIERVLNDGKVH